MGSEDLLSNEIKVAMGSRNDYKNLNVEWQHLHQSIKIFPLSKDGQLHVQLSSKQAINEPFLNFVVILDSFEGHSIRDYTILLDLPSVIEADKTQDSSLTVVTVQPQTNLQIIT